jgi:hypothetical protein
MWTASTCSIFRTALPLRLAAPTLAARWHCPTPNITCTLPPPRLQRPCPRQATPRPSGWRIIHGDGRLSVVTPAEGIRQLHHCGQAMALGNYQLTAGLVMNLQVPPLPAALLRASPRAALASADEREDATGGPLGSACPVFAVGSGVCAGHVVPVFASHSGGFSVVCKGGTTKVTLLLRLRASDADEYTPPTWACADVDLTINAATQMVLLEALSLGMGMSAREQRPLHVRLHVGAASDSRHAPKQAGSSGLQLTASLTTAFGGFWLAADAAIFPPIPLQVRRWGGGEGCLPIPPHPTHMGRQEEPEVETQWKAAQCAALYNWRAAQRRMTMWLSRDARAGRRLLEDAGVRHDVQSTARHKLLWALPQVPDKVRYASDAMASLLPVVTASLAGRADYWPAGARRHALVWPAAALNKGRLGKLREATAVPTASSTSAAVAAGGAGRPSADRAPDARGGGAAGGAGAALAEASFSLEHVDRLLSKVKDVATAVAAAHTISRMHATSADALESLADALLARLVGHHPKVAGDCMLRLVTELCQQSHRWCDEIPRVKLMAADVGASGEGWYFDVSGAGAEALRTWQGRYDDMADAQAAAQRACDLRVLLLDRLAKAVDQSAELQVLVTAQVADEENGALTGALLRDRQVLRAARQRDLDAQLQNTVAALGSLYSVAGLRANGPVQVALDTLQQRLTPISLTPDASAAEAMCNLLNHCAVKLCQEDVRRGEARLERYKDFLRLLSGSTLPPGTRTVVSAARLRLESIAPVAPAQLPRQAGPGHADLMVQFMRGMMAGAGGVGAPLPLPAPAPNAMGLHALYRHPMFPMPYPAGVHWPFWAPGAGGMPPVLPHAVPGGAGAAGAAAPGKAAVRRS